MKRIGTSGAIFDIDKLTWMNGMYLRNMEIHDYLKLVDNHIKNAVKGNYDHLAIAKILQQRANTLNEIDEMLDFFDNYPEFDINLYTNKKMKTNPEVALNSLKAAYDTLNKLEDWSEESLHDTLMNLVSTLQIKNGQLLYPIRVALTNKQFTPGGAIEIGHILQKEETLRRIKTSIDNLEK